MVVVHPEVARHRALKAVAHRKNDPSAIERSARDLAAAKIADYIERTVAAAPPLTAEQRDRLAALLRGGGADAA